MYLKSIEVHGFKSFANKIVFEFHNGITGIVGPNGSGKSNVGDAVRWVLGEQSAKQLRGSNMQDIIFSGTELRKPLGFAYVAITLDNSDHKLPVDYEEVTVARRVYRSGESEYLINGTNCRLRDVQELFLDTGIGKEGYSIIGQGQIDRILSGKPEERRELFDEAAGIVKFKKRKSIAEKELEEERLNLSRISDILTEIEKQIGPLEKQSLVAKEYLRLKDELKKLEVNQFLLEYEKNSDHKAAVNKKLQIVTDDLTSTKNQFESTKAEYEKLESTLEVINTDLEATRTKKNELQLDLEKTDGEIKVLEEQIASIIQNGAMYESRISSVFENRKAKEEELQKFNQQKNEVEDAYAAINSRQSAANEDLNFIRDAITALTKEIETCNSDIFKYLNENGTIKTNIQRYETILEQNNIKKAEINQKVLKNKSEEATIGLAADEFKKQVLQAEEAIQKKKGDLKQLEEHIVAEQKKMDEMGAKLYQKNQSYLSENAKLDSLRNLTERYDGYGNSIRRVMEQKANNPGIIGVVADIIKVEKSYETAIETALGGNIQNIVTDNENTAKALIEFLKKNKFGRATFLPLTSMKASGTPNQNALNEKGVIGLASTLVQAEERFSGLIQSLLGRIYVVDHIDNAIALARKYNYTLRIVTLEGEQLNPGGSLSGGAYKNASNLLGRRREMEELEKKVAALKAETEEIQVQREESKNLRQKYREEVEAGKSALQKLFVEENTAKLSLRQEEEKVEEIKKTYTEFARELKELESQNQDLSGNLSRLNQELNENMRLSKDLEARIDECNRMLSDKRKEEAASNESAASLRVELSNLDQRRGYALENIRRVSAEIAHLNAEADQLKEEAENSSRQKILKEELIEGNKKKREMDVQSLSESEAKLENLTEQKESMTRDHKSFFSKREELSGRMNDLDKEVFRLQNQLEKLEEALDHLITYMWEEYELTISSAEEFKDEKLFDFDTNRKGIAEYKGKIKNLGDVNVNAIEDFRNLSERFEFMSTQKLDLEVAEGKLIELIEELDEEMRKQFEEKFAEIKAQFDLVFKELFGGGKGTLELTEGEDILEAGIRINASPPGKKLQNMMQLSGGEKALTAISLLFAIQSLKPSPFCLLDEIEAALDDSNVKRYANYLHKLTKDTQFIIITHRRGTMAAADRLYGITMQEKGVSTLVSVSLIEDELEK